MKKMLIEHKVFLFLLPILFIFTIILYLYISEINFCGEITIKNYFKNTNKIHFFGITPTGKTVDFVNKDRNTYYINGYYKSLYCIFSDENLIVTPDSVVLFINGKMLNLNRYCFYDYFNVYQIKSDFLCHYLNYNSKAKNWFTKASYFLKFSFSFYLVFNVFLLLLICFGIFAFIKIKYKNIVTVCKKLTKNQIISFCIGLFVVYSAIFSLTIKFNNSVELSGDYLVYQTEAVNLIKGSALGNQTVFEKYKYDNVNVDSTTLQGFIPKCQNKSITCVPPVYPMFLALIYKLFGVSPLIVRYFQLFLLIFVASFIPLLLFFLFNEKGFILGILAGFIFITTQYNLANEIMTEPLMVFFSFLTLCSITFFERRNNVFSASVLGIILALALLVKGIILFVVIFYFILLLFQSLKGKKYCKSWIIVASVFIMVLIPWIIYSNINDGLIQKRTASKQELSIMINKINNIIYDKTYYCNENDRLDSIKKLITNYQSILSENELLNFNYIINDSGLNVQEKIELLRASLVKFNYNIRELLDSKCFKMKSGNYIYFNKKKLVIISTNHEQNILESNNENCLDGDLHKNELIVQTYDNNYYQSSLLRVLNFYYSHPNLILIIFPHKLYAGYHNFIFFLLLMALIISDFIMLQFKNKHKLLNKIEKIFLFGLVPTLLFFCNYNFIGFIFCFVLAILIICFSIARNTPLQIFNLPKSFMLFIINFILITLIFFGSERFTSIVNFIIIISAILCFFEYYSQLFEFNDK